MFFPQFLPLGQSLSVGDGDDDDDDDDDDQVGSVVLHVDVHVDFLLHSNDSVVASVVLYVPYI